MNNENTSIPDGLRFLGESDGLFAYQTNIRGVVSRRLFGTHEAAERYADDHGVGIVFPPSYKPSTPQPEAGSGAGTPSQEPCPTPRSRAELRASLHEHFSAAIICGELPKNTDICYIVGLAFDVAATSLNLAEAQVAELTRERDAANAECDEICRAMDCSRADAEWHPAHLAEDLIRTRAKARVEADALRESDRALRAALGEWRKAYSEWSGELGEVGYCEFIVTVGMLNRTDAALAQTPAALADDLAELRRDRERLDWLRDNTRVFEANSKRTGIEFYVPVAKSLREAIDAARAGAEAKT